jgi:hypothetical protein
MYTAQFVGGVDPDMLRRVFHSGQMPPNGLNRAHYTNVAVDRLIEQASAMTDDEQRRVLYGQAQTAIARDVPVISLWYKTNVAVFQPDDPAVQRAGDAAAEDDALRQRAALVRAAIEQREDAVVRGAEHRDRPAGATLHAARTEGRDVVDAADGDPVVHGACLLQAFTPGSMG